MAPRGWTPPGSPRKTLAGRVFNRGAWLVGIMKLADKDAGRSESWDAGGGRGATAGRSEGGPVAAKTLDGVFWQYKPDGATRPAARGGGGMWRRGGGGGWALKPHLNKFPGGRDKDRVLQDENYSETCF